MLGYIKAYKPELRVKEYEFYKAVYCSLCKDMGKRYGFFTRFFLSYDFTFLALLNMSLSDGAVEIKKGVCTCNPLKKCSYCKNCADIAFPSAVSVIMTYYKFADNVADERGIKRAAYFILRLLYSRAHKKAAHDRPDIEKAVCGYVNAQALLEKENCTDIDRASEPTSAVLADIFSRCSQDENEKRALSRLGYCMGKYIYLADAVEDLEKDKKRGRYNPLCTVPDARERAKRSIYMCINESIKAFEVLNIKKIKNILGNIIYIGLEDTYKRSILNERPV